MKDLNRSPIPGNPLARLVLFMIFLAIAGSCVAGAHYFSIDLPAGKTIQTPVNAKGDDTTIRDAQMDIIRQMIEQENELKKHIISNI